jgi:hypothetical protein
MALFVTNFEGPLMNGSIVHRESVLAVLFLMSCLCVAKADDPAITLTGEDGIGYPDSDSLHGWQFVANQSIRVTHLGLFDGVADGGLDGFAADRPIGLFRLADAALLTSGVMHQGTGDQRIGSFRYVDTPDVVLEKDQTYVISFFTHVADPSDTQVTSATNILNVNPVITYVSSRWDYGSGLAIPGNLLSPGPFGNDRFGPNFLFSIPEPSTAALLIISCVMALVVGRR